MTNKKKALIILSPVVLLFVVMLLLQKNFIYFSEEITGTVIDWETGKPIEGICVAALWEPYYPAPGSGGHGKAYVAREAVSDKDGSYRIPSWGPKLAPFLGSLDKDPSLSYFRDGYEFLILSNDKESNSMIRKSDWNKKTIKLQKFKGNIDAKFQDLSFIRNHVIDEVDTPINIKCTIKAWKDAVKMHRNYPYSEDLPDYVERQRGSHLSF